MKNNFQIDNLDHMILDLITIDARIPFLEVARKCNISGAAVHQRVQKLVDAGIISGSGFHLSPKGLGYITCAFIGLQVNLISTSTHDNVFNK
ncbi:MAG: AsnC family transcriptional regulator, partial [Cytophagia bacterium]|nr:AsnC family transcriptional regulator [Cytophagia bacterium]